MCKIFGKLVDKLGKFLGKIRVILVEKFRAHISVGKIIYYSTNFYRRFSQSFFAAQPLYFTQISTTSTLLTTATKLNKGGGK